MWDFPYEEPNFITSFVPLLMYAIVSICWNNKLISTINTHAFKMSKPKNRLWFIALILIVTCCSVDGDFFSLMKVVQYFSIGGYNYGEKIYHILILYVNKNYFLFRLIVWGGALSVYALTAWRFKIPLLYASLYLFLGFAVIFCYARVSLCMALCFFALSFFCIPLKKFQYLGYAIGFVIFYFSTFFHSSSYIMIALCAMIVLPVNKKVVILFIIASPIMLKIAQDTFLDIAAMSEGFENEGVAERLQRGVSQTREGSLLNINDPGVFLHTFLLYVSFYVPIFIVSKIFLNGDKAVFPTYVYRLFKVCFAFILASTILLFFNIGGYNMYFRVLFMTMMPLSLLIVYLYTNKMMTIKQFKYCLYAGVVANFIRVLYGVYGYGL